MYGALQQSRLTVQPGVLIEGRVSNGSLFFIYSINIQNMNKQDLIKLTEFAKINNLMELKFEEVHALYLAASKK